MDKKISKGSSDLIEVANFFCSAAGGAFEVEESTVTGGKSDSRSDFPSFIGVEPDLIPE